MTQRLDASTPFVNEIRIGTPPQPLLAQMPQYATPTAQIVTADVATYGVNDLFGGVILRDPTGANRADLTPTAALIIAGMTGGPVVGQSFMFSIINQADAAETITLTAGVGVTIVGVATIAQNAQRLFLCRVTSATTVSIYALT